MTPKKEIVYDEEGNEIEIVYDEEEDFWYIAPPSSSTDDWTGVDLVECPEDWIYDDEISFDESDYFELEKRINSSDDDMELVTHNFLKEKCILDILLKKGIKF